MSNVAPSWMATVIWAAPNCLPSIGPEVQWVSVTAPTLRRALNSRPRDGGLDAKASLAGGQWERATDSSSPVSSANLGEWLELLRYGPSVDTLFWTQGGARPEFPVHLFSLLSGRVRRAAFVIDTWKPILSKIGMLAVAQRLDPCFVAFREGYEELRARFPGGRFEWLPFGIDTDVFDSMSQERPIFAFWMGRRYEPLHQAMIRYCADRGLEYRYRQPGQFPLKEAAPTQG